MFHSQCFLSIVAILIIPIDGNQNPPQKFPLDPPPLPQSTGQGGCPPKMLPPPFPRFSFFMNGPPPPCSAQNRGLPLHCSSSKRSVSRGMSDKRGRGDYPSGYGHGGWGTSWLGWGYTLHRPNQICPPPPSPLFLMWGGGGVVSC